MPVPVCWSPVLTRDIAVAVTSFHSTLAVMQGDTSYVRRHRPVRTQCTRRLVPLRLVGADRARGAGSEACVGVGARGTHVCKRDTRGFKYTKYRVSI